jgi:hypothetical protein
LIALGVDPKQRAERLDINTYVRLAKNLTPVNIRE